MGRGKMVLKIHRVSRKIYLKKKLKIVLQEQREEEEGGDDDSRGYVLVFHLSFPVIYGICHDCCKEHASIFCSIFLTINVISYIASSSLSSLVQMICRFVMKAALSLVTAQRLTQTNSGQTITVQSPITIWARNSCLQRLEYKSGQITIKLFDAC